MNTSPGIFLSYRRHDSSGHAGRLFDGLAGRFGEKRIFMDVDGIAPGADFWQRIHDVIDECAVVLVLIGDEWLSASDGTSGHRRLDDPGDFVRQEIAVALSRDVMMVPVLVHGATMPSEHELPEDIAKLARHNAHELSDTRWRYDLDRLISAVENALAPPATARDEAGQDAVVSSFEEVALDDWDRPAQGARRWPWNR